MEGPSLQDLHKVVDGRMEILFPNRSPQFSTQKGRLRKRSGPTAKNAAELGVSQYSYAMTMTLRLRKFTLTAYVIFSVGWLGAVVAYLTLAIAALTSHDVQLSGKQPVVGRIDVS